MSHTPWTQEDVEKWAMESEVVRKATFEDDAIEGFKAGMAKAAEMIEAAPTVYGETTIVQYGREVPTGNWTETRIDTYDTHSAKLVGVRPIEEEK